MLFPWAVVNEIRGRTLQLLQAHDAICRGVSLRGPKEQYKEVASVGIRS